MYNGESVSLAEYGRMTLTAICTFVSGASTAISLKGFGTVNDDIALLASKYRKSAPEIDCPTTTKMTGGVDKTPDVETTGFCFIEGTKISTINGKVTIESICEGDYVLAGDPDTGDVTYHKVLEIYRNSADTLVHVTLENNEEIVTTLTHPFYVSGEGWIEAGNLKLNDHLLDANGNLIHIKDIWVENLEESITVYNFAVEDYHTYYVGDTQVLVHNTCMAEPPTGSETRIGKSSGNLTEGSTGSENYVYRALNQKDYERYLQGLGLEAKNPNGSWDLKEHLVNGSGKLSWSNDPYISTTTDLDVANGFNRAGSGYGVVKIDMNKVPSSSYKGYEIYPRVNGVEGLPYHYSIWCNGILNL